MKRALLIASFTLVACGPPPPPPGGTALMRFAVSDKVTTSMNLRDPLKGNFYGQVFLVEDVGITGPRDNAMEYHYIEVKNIDLTGKGADEPSEVSYTTAKLAPGSYVALGFFDVDGNVVDSDKSPDPGDPVTLALTNKFEITSDAETKRLILMELVFN